MLMNKPTIITKEIMLNNFNLDSFTSDLNNDWKVILTLSDRLILIKYG